MKRCPKCEEEKPFSEYYKNKANRDGLQSRCKPCTRATNKANYAKNGEKYRERAAEYRNRTKEQTSARRRKWSKENPDRICEYSARRRAWKRGCDVVPYSRTQVMDVWNGKCAYCTSTASHIDHIYPLSRGGSDSFGNVVPACSDCNLRKSNKTLNELGWKIRVPA